METQYLIAPAVVAAGAEVGGKIIGGIADQIINPYGPAATLPPSEITTGHLGPLILMNLD